MKQVKSLMAIIVVMVLAFSAVPAHSQTGVSGTTPGALLFGDGSYSDTAATVIYTISNVSERVKNPLEIRMASTWGCFKNGDMGFTGHPTLRELFERAVKDSQKYEVLQVVRALSETSSYATIWFAYIEKESILPLKQ
jgi:hypothetical protein